MSAWRPVVDREKYKQAVLFILNSSANNLQLGKVKLFKLLYYLDFDHFQTYKKPITGDMYRKLAYGPVPKTAEDILNELRKNEQLTVSRRQVGDYWQYVFTPLTKPDIHTFEASEIETLEQVVKKWANHTTNEIIAATHGEAPWRAVEMGEEIPYALAFYRRQLSEEEGGDEEKLNEPLEVA